MRNIQFNSDGTQLFFAGNENTRMNKYSLSTAYDITTLSSTFTTFDLGSRVNNMMGFIFSSNFTKLFGSDDGSYQVQIKFMNMKLIVQEQLLVLILLLMLMLKLLSKLM